MGKIVRIGLVFALYTAIYMWVIPANPYAAGLLTVVAVVMIAIMVASVRGLIDGFYFLLPGPHQRRD